MNWKKLAAGGAAVALFIYFMKKGQADAQRQEMLTEEPDNEAIARSTALLERANRQMPGLNVPVDVRDAQRQQAENQQAQQGTVAEQGVMNEIQSEISALDEASPNLRVMPNASNTQANLIDQIAGSALDYADPTTPGPLTQRMMEYRQAQNAGSTLEQPPMLPPSGPIPRPSPGMMQEEPPMPMPENGNGVVLSPEAEQQTLQEEYEDAQPFSVTSSGALQLRPPEAGEPYPNSPESWSMPFSSRGI